MFFKPSAVKEKAQSEKIGKDFGRVNSPASSSQNVHLIYRFAFESVAESDRGDSVDTSTPIHVWLNSAYESGSIQRNATVVVRPFNDSVDDLAILGPNISLIDTWAHYPDYFRAGQTTELFILTPKTISDTSIYFAALHWSGDVMGISNKESNTETRYSDDVTTLSNMSTADLDDYIIIGFGQPLKRKLLDKSYAHSMIVVNNNVNRLPWGTSLSLFQQYRLKLFLEKNETNFLPMFVLENETPDAVVHSILHSWNIRELLLSEDGEDEETLSIATLSGANMLIGDTVQIRPSEAHDRDETLLISPATVAILTGSTKLLEVALDYGTPNLWYRTQDGMRQIWMAVFYIMKRISPLSVTPMVTILQQRSIGYPIDMPLAAFAEMFDIDAKVMVELFSKQLMKDLLIA